MTPEHTSAYELVKALHALDPSTSAISVGDVSVRFERAPLMPLELPMAPRQVTELEAEVKALQMKLSQADPEGLY